MTVDEGAGRFGWLLLRASLHDPLLVLNVETELDDGMYCYIATNYVSLLLLYMGTKSQLV